MAQLGKPFNVPQDIKSIPRFSQTQRSLDEQLRDLWTLANHFGLYDAADYLGNNIGLGRK